MQFMPLYLIVNNRVKKFKLFDVKNMYKKTTK